MARFIGRAVGSRGETSRVGHKVIRTEANGWNSGVTVVGAPQRSGGGTDEFMVYLTHGSEDSVSGLRLGELLTAPSGKRFFHLSDEAIDAIRLGSNVIELDD